MIKTKKGVGGGLRRKQGRIVRRKPTSGKKRASKVPSISKLIKTADALFSIKVRRLNGFLDTVGYGGQADITQNVCFTCGKWYPIKKLHCGHYLSRYYKAARWNYDNARPQCMMCNMWKRGDPIVFRRNLINEIGEARVLAVEALRDAPIKLSREYLESLILILKQTQPPTP